MSNNGFDILMMELKCPNSDPGESKNNAHEIEIIKLMRDNSDFNGHQSIFGNSGFSKKNPYIYTSLTVLKDQQNMKIMLF